MRINNIIVIVPRAPGYERLRDLEERYHLRLDGVPPAEIQNEYEVLLRMRTREDYAPRLLVAGLLTFPCGDIAGAVSQERSVETVESDCEPSAPAGILIRQ